MGPRAAANAPHSDVFVVPTNAKASSGKALAQWQTQQTLRPQNKRMTFAGPDGFGGEPTHTA